MSVKIPNLCAPACRAGWRAPCLVLAVGLALGGCESLLEVESASRLPADEIRTPGNAPILVDGAQADFECALANYIVAGGQVGDELDHRGGGSVTQGYDRRDYIPADRWYAVFPCESGPGSQDAISVYAPLQTARSAASEAEKLLSDWIDEQVPDRTALIARAAAFAGYGTLLLGEGFCSMALDLGPEISRSEVFEVAEQAFTRALEAATSAGTTDLHRLAQVGRARARLNLADFTGALADARELPEGFRFEGRYSGAAARTENQVFVSNNRSRNVSIGRHYHDMEFQGVPDPRVRVRNDGPVVPGDPDSVWVQDGLYVSESSPILIATWEEAQLIIAEAELETGNLHEAVNALNRLHANAGLPAFSSSDPDEIREHLIEERRRVLFLQGQHLNDLIRFNLPLLPPPGTPHRGGGEYGTMTCLPLPDVERANNPNIP